MKSAVCRAIDERQVEIEQLGREIFATPEVGFKEVRTAQLVTDWFTRLGLAPQTGLGLTGVKATLRGDGPGPTVAVLGGLDCPAYPALPDAGRR